MWSQNVHTIRYQYTNSVDGAPAVPKDANGAFGEKYDVEDAPVLEGYGFSGWTTEDTTILSDAFTMPDHDVTFIGTWTKIETPEEPSEPTRPIRPPYRPSGSSSSSDSNRTSNTPVAPTEEKSDGNPFTDVKKGSFYYDAVQWVVKKGIGNAGISGSEGAKIFYDRRQGRCMADISNEVALIQKA